MGGKQALVPRLRFPEFWDSGEWRFTPLKKLAKRCTEKNREGKLVKVLTNSAEHGVVDQRDYFNKDIAVQGNLEGYFIVKKGDFVYNPRISSMAPVGPISKNNIATGVMSPLYTVFRFTVENDDFYAHYFKTTGWHQYMHQVSSTGARHDRMAISKDDFISMPLPVSPMVEEQQKIADCLSSLDALIAAQAEKLDALKTHKKGLMQQLFPREGETIPPLRFPEFRDAGEWEEKTLGELVEVASGQVDPTDPTYCDMPHVGGENIESHTGSLQGMRTARELGLISGKYFFDGRDVLYSKIRPALNKVATPDFEGICSADIYPIRPSSQNLCRQYLAYLLLSEGFLKYATKNSDRSKIPKVNRNSIMAYELVIPCRLEQQCIVDCLSSLDALVNAQTEKLNALKSHKKGLMQQLFPAMD